MNRKMAETFSNSFQDLVSHLTFPDNLAAVGVFTLSPKRIDEAEDVEKAWETFEERYMSETAYKQFKEPEDYIVDPDDVEYGEDDILSKEKFVVVGINSMRALIDELTDTEIQNGLIFGIRLVTKEGLLVDPNTSLDIAKQLEDGTLEEVIGDHRIAVEQLIALASEEESVDKQVEREIVEQEKQREREQEQRRREEELAKSSDVRDHEQFIKDIEEAIHEYNQVDIESVTARLNQMATDYVERQFPKHEIDSSMEMLPTGDLTEEYYQVEPIVDLIKSRIEQRDKKANERMSAKRQDEISDMLALFQQHIIDEINRILNNTSFPTEDEPHRNNNFTNKVAELNDMRNERIVEVDTKADEFRTLRQKEYDDDKQEYIQKAMREAEVQFEELHGDDVDIDTSQHRDALLRSVDQQFERERESVHRQAAEERERAFEAIMPTLERRLADEVYESKDAYDRLVENTSITVERSVERDIDEAQSRLYDAIQAVRSDEQLRNKMVEEQVLVRTQDHDARARAAESERDHLVKQVEDQTGVIAEINQNYELMQDMLQKTTEHSAQLEEFYTEEVANKQQTLVIPGGAQPQVYQDGELVEDPENYNFEEYGSRVDKYNRKNWIPAVVTGLLATGLTLFGLYQITDRMDEANQGQVQQIQEQITNLEDSIANPNVIDTLEIGQTIPITNDEGDVLTAEITEIEDDMIYATGEDGVEYTLDISAFQDDE